MKTRKHFSAIARAWAELFTQDRALSSDEITWLLSLDGRFDLFLPGG
jgi:hypothetical protein